MALGKASWAVRLVGLKLLLFSVSLAATATAISPDAAQDFATASWGGMKLLHLILGTMGAGASLFFLPQFSGLALGRTVTCGILCALVGTPLLKALFVRYLGEPIEGAENVVAVVLGVGGVYIIPGAQKAWTAFREDPFAIVDRLRGKGGNNGGQP
jgi:hypothetical protein